MNEPLPHYRHWSEVPEQLLTATALDKLGLRPGAAEVATITYNRGRDQTVLFDRSQAVPKPPRTVRQQEGVLLAAQTREAKRLAIEKAREANRQRARAARRADLAAQLTRDSQAAHQQFRSWAQDPAALIIDTETTGLWGPVIEVGLCRVDGTPVFSQRIRVDEPIEPGAFEVHGITETDLRDCPVWAQVWPHLAPLMTGTILAFNSDFDAARMEQSVRPLLPPEQFEPVRRADGSTVHRGPLFRWECVMTAYTQYRAFWSPWHRDYRWWSLDDATYGLDLPERGMHGALGDAQRTAAVIRHVASGEPRSWTAEDVPEDWV